MANLKTNRKKTPLKTTLKRHHEALNESCGFYYEVGDVLYRKKTRYQEIKVVHTKEFGKVLLLDGIIQVSERDEFIYHEMLVHGGMLTHANPQSILVIGGGDGGANREVLKHPSVKQLVQVDLDDEVIAVCKKHFDFICQGSFEDPRVDLHIKDGRAFLKDTQALYDVIIMDMTDPVGPSRALYTVEFFRLVKKALSRKGVFCMHISSPITRPVAFGRIHKTLSHVFTNVNALYHYIHMYGTLWSIGVASDHYDLRQFSVATLRRRLLQRNLTHLRLMQAEGLHAMLRGHPYLDVLLKKKAILIRDANLHAFEG